MTQALSGPSSYDQYRRECVDIVLDASRRYGVPCAGKDVLDLGCFDGAITRGYADAAAASVVGVDIDKAAVASAQKNYGSARVRFVPSQTIAIPLESDCIDTIFCYDVMEHVSMVPEMLAECHRVLRPGGRMLVGTWGWYHPFAPHLWSIMPVPWAHVLFSERTMLRTCRRIYHSDWYVPNMHDFDESGQRKDDKYCHVEIPTDYLNKYLVRDFERVFRESPLEFHVHAQPFRSRWASWTRPLLKVPYLREFLTAYIWVVLEKPAERTQSVQRTRPARREAELAGV